MGAPAMSLEHQPTLESAGFKVVCEQCGSLSIKLTVPANAVTTAAILCGKCDAVRGTLAQLNDLARRGGDAFEF